MSTQTAEQNHRDAVIDDIRERVEDRLNGILRDEIADATGVSDFPGDVAPGTVHDHTEALNAMIGQLVDNAWARRFSPGAAHEALTLTLNVHDDVISETGTEFIGSGDALAIRFRDGEDWIWITDLNDYAGTPGFYVGYYTDDEDDGVDGVMDEVETPEALMAVVDAIIRNRMPSADAILQRVHDRYETGTWDRSESEISDGQTVMQSPSMVQRSWKGSALDCEGDRVPFIVTCTRSNHYTETRIYNGGDVADL